MTRQVLIFGLLILAGLATVWVAYLIILSSLPTSPRMGRIDFFTRAILDTENGPLTGLGPLVKLWLVLLVGAVVVDHFVVNDQGKLVGAFAAVVTSSDGTPATVTQQWEGFASHTWVAGTHEGREITVTIHHSSGRRTGPSLRIEIGCGCPWVMEIRRKSFLSDFAALAGAPIRTGDAALDDALVVQADDVGPVASWLRESTVRADVLAAFEHHRLDVLELSGAGVLRGTYETLRARRSLIQERAAAITTNLIAIAVSAELGSSRSL